jgi:4a-hydroxytetrahydrobiopterin dehydratase
MADQIKEKNIPDGQKTLPLEREKILELLKKLEDWDLSPDGKKIIRKFHFKNFRQAIDFVNEVASFAEKNGHYPELITIRTREVTVELATETIGGLTESDFTAAKEIDVIAGWQNSLQKWLSSPFIFIFLIIILCLIILWPHLR